MSTREFTIALIDLLQEEECLWTKHLASYGDRGERATTLKGIYERLHPYCEGLNESDVNRR